MSLWIHWNQRKYTKNKKTIIFILYEYFYFSFVICFNFLSLFYVLIYILLFTFVLKVFSFMIYMWRTVERKKKSHFDGTSSYTYQSYWNRKKYTKKIQLLCFHFFFSYFFLLLLDIVSFTLYMRRTVKRIKNSIWRDFFLYIWIFLEPGKIYKKR
jgi:hypothetical protein